MSGANVALSVTPLIARLLSLPAAFGFAVSSAKVTSVAAGVVLLIPIATKASAIAGSPSYLAVPLKTVTSSRNLTCSDLSILVPALSART